MKRFASAFLMHISLISLISMTSVFTVSAKADDSYYDHRGGKRYLCQLDEEFTPPRPECRYDSDCRTGYECVSGSCEKEKVSCITVCTDRYDGDIWYDSSRYGSCRTFGPDLCGPTPSCRENCTERYNGDIWKDSPRFGQCRTFGPDICSAD